MPGHKYTGPYNDLDKQLVHDDKGNIIKIYDPPSGATDAIAMQHDVDYSVCGDDKKCKHQADRKMVNGSLERETTGSLANQKCHQHKAKDWFGSKKKTDQNLASWGEKLADELHKPIKRNFAKRRVIAHNVDDIWCSDLVDMQKLSKWNRGYKYLLMVLDRFSKYGCIIPLKSKTGLEVSKAFQTIFKKNKPKMLWVDKAKEYYNKNVGDLLAKNKITMYSTENEEK